MCRQSPGLHAHASLCCNLYMWTSQRRLTADHVKTEKKKVAPKIDPWCHALHQSNPSGSGADCTNYTGPHGRLRDANTCFAVAMIGTVASILRRCRGFRFRKAPVTCICFLGAVKSGETGSLSVCKNNVSKSINNVAWRKNSDVPLNFPEKMSDLSTEMNHVSQNDAK